MHIRDVSRRDIIKMALKSLPRSHFARLRARLRDLHCCMEVISKSKRI